MKGQLSWGYVVTVIIFISFIAYLFLRTSSIHRTYIEEGKREALRARVFKLTQVLTEDPGEPSDWEKDYFSLLLAYRLPINISGNGFQDYPTLIFNLNTSALISQGKMRSDCGDIRFANESHDELPYFLEQNTCNTQNTSIWVRIPNLPLGKNTTIFMYYGSNSTTSKSSAKETFNFFDDFSDSSYTSDKWDFACKG